MNRLSKIIVGLILIGFGAVSELCAQMDSKSEVEKILSEVKNNKKSRNERMVEIAGKLNDFPARSFAESYQDTIQTDADLSPFDSRQFVETVLALTLASEKNNPDFNTYLEQLEGVRYRRGENTGYGSRMFYLADWITDNAYRGKIKDRTLDLPNNTSTMRTLDYISLHRDEFAGLKDSVQYERMKSLEMGFRLHKIPYMKIHSIGKKEVLEHVKSGDVIAIVGKVAGNDMFDMGLILIENGTPYYMHANPEAGKIVREPVPLNEYLKKYVKLIQGYRLLRIAE